MLKWIIVTAAFLALSPLAFAQDGVKRAPIGSVLQPAREVGITTLRALISAAEETGQSTVFIGGPTWSVDGSEKPKAGSYLLDNDMIAGVR